MLQNMPMEAVLRFSNAAAALNCMAIGARGHLPTLPEVNALIASADAGTIGRRTDWGILQEVADKELETTP